MVAIDRLKMVEFGFETRFVSTPTFHLTVGMKQIGNEELFYAANRFFSYRTELVPYTHKLRYFYI